MLCRSPTTALRKDCRPCTWGGFNDARGLLFAPSGEAVGNAFDSNVQVTRTLPETGTYVVRVNANNLVSTGSYNLGLECRKSPVAQVNGTLTCGTLLAGSITEAGEVDLLTFTGTAGQVVDLTLVETSAWGGVAGISNDARGQLFAPSGDAVGGAFDSNTQVTHTLPETGTYIVRINANNLVSTGSYNLGMECN